MKEETLNAMSRKGRMVSRTKVRRGVIKQESLRTEVGDVS